MKEYTSEDKVYSFEDIDLSGTYTYADYLRWEFNERLELIRGKVFRMSPGPATLHQRVLLELSYQMHHFLRRKSCEVFVAPFDVRLPLNSFEDKEIYTVVQPDLCVICDKSKLDVRGCIGAPEIVVEILSPGNSRKELKNKFEVYEEAGVLEYWILHPEEKTFFRYILDKGRFQPTKLLTLGDEVSSSVLPGFKLRLDEVFR
ncbi:Uma2 family endonuclease [Flavihumibacter sp. R14]|nr:Uma2 family endonuclease [Flavihumibacter soli]